MIMEPALTDQQHIKINNQVGNLSHLHQDQQRFEHGSVFFPRNLK
jgi:hypothetical protein